MNGRGKSVRLCVVFVMAGVLTVMCLARTTITIPSSVSHYLDIVIAILMVVLMLCVLELCLGVELCTAPCCCSSQDVEGRDRSLHLSPPDYCQAPPSYEVIMMQASTRGGGSTAAGRGRGQGRESEPLKRDFSVYFKRKFHGDYNSPPMRSLVSPGVSEASIMSANELWLTVDGLPSYEEAVARLREEEEEMVMKLQEEELMAHHREEMIPRPQELAWEGEGEGEGAAARLQEEGRG